jgi:hypothetical protein
VAHGAVFFINLRAGKVTGFVGPGMSPLNSASKTTVGLLRMARSDSVFERIVTVLETGSGSSHP